MDATYRFEVWSSSASVVVTEPAALASVVEIVRSGLDDVDRACSRFRSDSELSGLTAGTSRLSPLLADLVGTALDAAEASGGLVDPTVGVAMQQLGYDRSIELLPADGPPVQIVKEVPGWRRVHLYGDRLELPAGVLLDLGATAKARAADLLARRAADTVGVGVLVELGGDISTAGAAPAGGWQVLVRDTEDDPACQVTLTQGFAVATSSSVRVAPARLRFHRKGSLLPEAAEASPRERLPFRRASASTAHPDSARA